MVKEKEELKFKEEPSVVKNFIVGINERGFLLGFNRNDDNILEKAFFIKAENLSDIIGVLFESGIKYQEETGIDIGFGMEE